MSLTAGHFGRLGRKIPHLIFNRSDWSNCNWPYCRFCLHVSSTNKRVYTCMPGGEGSLRTSIRISCLLESRALTASWCVACRRSMVFTSKIRSPTRSPLWEAKPLGMTYSETIRSEISTDHKSWHSFLTKTCIMLHILLYLWDEHPWLINSKWMAGMVTSPYNAQTQGTTCFDQRHLLSRHEIQIYEKGVLILQ